MRSERGGEKCKVVDGLAFIILVIRSRGSSISLD